MAYRSGVPSLEQRSQRDRAYAAAPELSTRFPNLSALTIDLRFVMPDRKPVLSPYRQVYTAGMQAFFELQCPMKECSDGGFDLTRAVNTGATAKSSETSGTARCTGRRAGDTCGVELTYRLEFERAAKTRRA